MALPTQLDEYSDEDLKAELRRREERRKKGLCDYCGRNIREPACRFAERHGNRATRRSNLRPQLADLRTLGKPAAEAPPGPHTKHPEVAVSPSLRKS